jgi:hypothetical protein
MKVVKHRNNGFPNEHSRFHGLIIEWRNLWIGVGLYVHFAYFYLKIELRFILEFLMYIEQHIDHNK